MKLKFPGALAAILVCLVSSRLYGQVITDFSPMVGSPGDTITINGSGFNSSDKIYFFNGKLATASVPSTSQILATVPAATVTGPIGVRLGTGTTTCGLDGFNCSAADFTVVGSGPYITDVSPYIGAVGDSVTINGVHFLNATSVKFAGTNAAFTTDSMGRQIFVNVPPAAHSGFITVTGPGGTGTSPSAFTVIGPGPYISGFTPAAGLSGTTVFINGRHFTGLSSVTFNGVTASATATADTQIQATTPAGVTTGPIKVTTSIGNYTSPTNFFVPPSVTGFSPGLGLPGAGFAITGKNFMGATAVTVNGGAAAFVINNNSNISATIPSGVNSGLVRVTAPAGSAFSTSNLRIYASISGFSPRFGPAGTTVTISGGNLNEGLSSIKFNGVSATFSTPSFGSVNVTVPASTTGKITLTTTNNTVTTAGDFSFPASITSLTPGTGSGGTTVTIRGLNFLDTTAVTFNGVAASYTVNNNTNITATAPAGVSSGPVAVTTPAGTATSAAKFYAPPGISSFTPTHGIVGTMVSLAGANFLDATAVQFAGTNSSFTVLNNNSIQATVPAGAQTGKIKVIAPGGSFTTSTNFVLDYLSDLAVIITDSPDPVTVGSNLSYTVYVQNNGPNNAPSVVLTNYLPSSVVLKLAFPTQGTLSTNGNAVIANLGTINASGFASMYLTVTPTNAGTIYDSAIAASGYVDPVASNSVASAVTIVEPLPYVSISRAANNQVRVAWVAGLSNFTLQYKSTLGANSAWISNSALPTLTNNQNVILEPATNARRFYRLVK